MSFYDHWPFARFRHSSQQSQRDPQGLLGVMTCCTNLAQLAEGLLPSWAEHPPLCLAVCPGTLCQDPSSQPSSQDSLTSVFLHSWKGALPQSGQKGLVTALPFWVSVSPSMPHDDSCPCPLTWVGGARF